MLSQKELQVLLSIINEEEKTLETISAQFHRSFAKGDHFRVGCCLYVLLQDDLVGKLCSRLVAFYILYDLYRTEHLASNPFLPVFIDTLQKDIDPVERNFISHILTLKFKEMGKKSPKELVTTYDRKSQLPVPDLNSLKKLYLERQPLKHSSCGISPLMFDPPDESWLLPGDSPNQDDSEQERDLIAQIVEDLNFSSFEPQFIRPVPPLHELKEDDLIWLNPEEEYDVLWDTTMCAKTDGTNEIKELMARAFKSQLPADLTKKVLKELELNPKLVYHCGLTPKKLPELVENNPAIAIECLLKLMPSIQITDYFSVLVNMEMSLHSMEVVNRLTTAVELPQEFVHLYISNCIQSCHNIKDKFLENRLVRLVCVFLQSLIRNKIVSVKDVMLDVQAFCIEYSRIREAAVLFRMLKNME